MENNKRFFLPPENFSVCQLGDELTIRVLLRTIIFKDVRT